MLFFGASAGELCFELFPLLSVRAQGHVSATLSYAMAASLHCSHLNNSPPFNQIIDALAQPSKHIGSLIMPFREPQQELRGVAWASSSAILLHLVEYGMQRGKYLFGIIYE